jgi:hypothetical protein
MTGPVIQLDQFTSLLTEVEAEPRLARRFARVRPRLRSRRHGACHDQAQWRSGRDRPHCRTRRVSGGGRRRGNQPPFDARPERPRVGVLRLVHSETEVMS